MAFVAKRVRLMVPSNKAKPSPQIGQALGSLGINMMKFCKEFNAVTTKYADVSTGRHAQCANEQPSCHPSPFLRERRLYSAASSSAEESCAQYARPTNGRCGV
jgi:hypothetical protein